MSGFLVFFIVSVIVMLYLEHYYFYKCWHTYEDFLDFNKASTFMLVNVVLALIINIIINMLIYGSQWGIIWPIACIFFFTFIMLTIYFFYKIFYKEWKRKFSGKEKKFFKSPIGGATKFIELELIHEDLNFKMDDDDKYYSDTFFEARHIKFPEYDLDLDIHPYGKNKSILVLGIVSNDNEIFVRRLKRIIERAFEILDNIDTTS
jgi:hypothetical protein